MIGMKKNGRRYGRQISKNIWEESTSSNRISISFIYAQSNSVRV